MAAAANLLLHVGIEIIVNAPHVNMACYLFKLHHCPFSTGIALLANACPCNRCGFRYTSSLLLFLPHEIKYHSSCVQGEWRVRNLEQELKVSELNISNITNSIRNTKARLNAQARALKAMQG